MEPPVLPPPPPPRLLSECGWVNEHETVDWYTTIGKQYPNQYSGRKWFKREWEKKLLEGIEINHQAVKEEKCDYDEVIGY